MVKLTSRESLLYSTSFFPSKTRSQNSPSKCIWWCQCLHSLPFCCLWSRHGSGWPCIALFQTLCGIRSTTEGTICYRRRDESVWVCEWTDYTKTQMSYFYWFVAATTEQVHIDDLAALFLLIFSHALSSLTSTPNPLLSAYQRYFIGSVRSYDLNTISQLVSWALSRSDSERVVGKFESFDVKSYDADTLGWFGR